jgi:hypothetical protein
MVFADRSVGDHPKLAAACMRAAMAKQPSRLTMSVPYGKVVPKR